MSKQSTPYAVGYGRPPAANQFKAGQSGNPKGRPKGSRNMITLLREELEAKVLVTENGVQKRMSKGQVAVRQQMDKAVKGDSRAFQTIMKLDATLGAGSSVSSTEGGPATSEIPPSAYDDIIATFLEDYRKGDAT